MKNYFVAKKNLPNRKPYEIMIDTMDNLVNPPIGSLVSKN